MAAPATSPNERTVAGAITVGELERRATAWSERQPTVATCFFCPDWKATGTTAETRAAAAKHRKQEHPQAKSMTQTERKNRAKEAQNSQATYFRGDPPKRGRPPTPVARRAYVVELLQEIAAETGKTPRMDDHKALASRAVKAFGSWNKAIVEAGLTPRKPGPPPRRRAPA